MRDAENLAWKMAMVSAGHANDRLLDTYDTERRPHAAAQVRHSVDAGLLIEAIADDEKAALESGYGRRGFPSLEHGLIDGDHPAVGRPLVQRARDRNLTVSATNGWVLIRGASDVGGVPEVWSRIGAEVSNVAAGSYPDLLGPGITVIVRPDRYVAAVTADLDSTSSRLSSHFAV